MACEEPRRSWIQEKWRVHICRACSLPRLSRPSRIQKGKHMNCFVQLYIASLFLNAIQRHDPTK
ncbi:hypothetical protein GBA52_019812 [Prunus armeniaca]|nr:hypothetical protein GBA52_019812 [Prunus armeniaca]